MNFERSIWRKKTKNQQKTPTQTHDVASNPRRGGSGWCALPLGSGILVVQRRSKGQSLSDPKNPYLRAWLLGLHVPHAARDGEAGRSWEGSQWKKAPLGPPVSAVMHNHNPGQLGLVSAVPGIAWCGDEDEDEGLLGIFVPQEPQPGKGTIGLGCCPSQSPPGPQGKT